MDNLFTKESFQCNKYCGECCKKLSVMVSKEDIKNITKLGYEKEDFLDKEIDIIITLCNSAQELCPVFPGKVEQLHWDVPDPFPGWVEDSHFLPKFREVRNIIRGRIDTFLQNH